MKGWSIGKAGTLFCSLNLAYAPHMSGYRATALPLGTAQAANR